MKYFVVPFIVIFLSACQSILSQNNASSVDNSTTNEALAQPLDIHQALIVDEHIDVAHPIADVDFVVDETLVKDETIWPRMQQQFTFEIPEQPRLVSERNWYAKHPSYLNRVAKRAEPFLHYIVEALEENNMPLELALLPIVESAFDPFAYSHGRASGMWQFVPATGERFGMKQNWWYDGRRDIVASTAGAIKYLKYLNRFFDGDWMLALAAYNSGEGRVRNAVRKNKRLGKPTDFWSLDLPKETRAYVPKLLALADIIKRPKDFNVDLHPINNQPFVGQVAIQSQLDLAKAASLAGLSLAELQRLNPGFNRWATDPDGPHSLLLPLSRIKDFSEGLEKLTKKDRLAWQRYKIKTGDNLGVIAENFNTRVSLIQEVNNIQGNNIRAGKYLLIPVAAQNLDSYVFSQEQRIAKKQQRSQKGRKVVHTVKSGDNLWDISRQYKVNSSQIARWNGFAPRDTLKIGQTLVVWQKDSKVSSSKADNAVMRNIIYKVKSGDSFARIANKFNVRIGDIERWNKLDRGKYLQPGQRLKLSVDVTNNI